MHHMCLELHVAMLFSQGRLLVWSFMPYEPGVTPDRAVRVQLPNLLIEATASRPCSPQLDHPTSPSRS